jgi:hypothetical protein
MGELIELGQLLFESDNLYKPDGWRLLQFLALEEGAKNADKYRITGEEFKASTQPVIARFPDHKVSCSNSTYLIISAESQLLVSKGPKYIDVGSFLGMGKEEFIRSVGGKVLRLTSDNQAWRND